jgi:hypothetical protein
MAAPKSSPVETPAQLAALMRRNRHNRARLLTADANWLGRYALEVRATGDAVAAERLASIGGRIHDWIRDTRPRK